MSHEAVEDRADRNKEDRIGLVAGPAVDLAADSVVWPAPAKADRGLLLIGLFKLAKSLFFLAVGIGALHLIRTNLAAEVMRLMLALRRDPEGRLVQLTLEKVDLIDQHRLKQITAFAFLYSALSLTEGIGLVLEKVWAEYITLSLTVLFLPWELFELARQPTWLRAALLATNLLVLGYLLWILRRKRRQQASAPDPTAASRQKP